MNKVFLLGRTTKDIELRYSGKGKDAMAIANFTLAVDRRSKDDNADFISCVAFGKTAEFLEEYVPKGTKICVEGHIQTGSYENKDGNTIYTTDVIVENVEFAQSKPDDSDKKRRK